MFEGLRTIAKGESNIDFIGRTRTWFTISSLLLAACILGLVLRGFNLGLEFKGGTSFTVPLKTSATVNEIKDAITRFNLGEAQVQTETVRSSGERQARVRVEHIEDRTKLTQVQGALARVAGQLDATGEPNVDAVSIDDVGPNWGRQVSNKALRGLIVFLVAVGLYISFRFEPKMAVAALIALAHDLIVTAGIYALVGFTVTPATVIALLTLLGYSLYDTVVVFDRVRENSEALGAGRSSYSDMVNKSVNQVLMRSMNTSLTSLLPVGALLFVGSYLLKAETLQDLALALFVGILVGTYSSVFIASPVLALWKQREPKYQARTARAGARATARPAVATATAGVASGTEVSDEPAEAGPKPRAPVRPGPRPNPRGRKRRGGKRRR
jgi:preprotein translocase subunit SecF